MIVPKKVDRMEYEMGGIAIEEFVGLKTKIYSFFSG